MKEYFEANDEDDEISELFWESQKLNDIFPPEEKTDIDMSGLFSLSVLWPLYKLKKRVVRDIGMFGKKRINLSLFPKIKLLQLKHPIVDISVKKKKKDVVLSQYEPSITPHTLDLSYLEMLAQDDSQALPDMHIPQYPVRYRLYFLLKTFKKNSIHFFLQKKNILYFVLSFLVLCSLGLYKIWVEHKLYTTLEKVKEMEFSQKPAILKQQIQEISSDFRVLHVALQPMFLINNFIGLQEVKNLEYVITWVNFLLNSSEKWIYLYDSFLYLLEQKELSQISFWDFFLNALPTLLEISQEVNQAIQHFSLVLFEPGDPLWDKFYTWLTVLKQFQNTSETFFSNIDVLENILWNTHKRTYMILFQNNDEIRPTGWFMGSVMFIDIFRGKILEIHKKDIYALEWPLKPFTQPAPAGLDRITPTFGLRDANYYVETGRSSNEIQKFLEKSWVHIDGIVYINQNVITDLLTQTWPLFFPEEQREISAENFPWIFSTLVESKVFKEGTLGTPKQILFDFVPLFFTHVQDKLSYTDLAWSLWNSFEKRDILLWSTNEEENQYLSSLWLENEPKNYDTYLDFAYPYFTSISGNKSDRSIQRSFSKIYTTDENCTITTDFEIRSQHTFSISDELEIKSFLYDQEILWMIDIDETLLIQWKWENKQYVRVYIPKNAVISSREDYTITQFSDYKEISFYLNTPLNTTRNFTFSYQILNPECQKYQFHFFKQSWLRGYDMKIQKENELLHESFHQKDFVFQENETF